MSAVSDAIITYALLKRITTPIKETRAYKMGLVNDEGAVTEKGHHDHSEQARDALTLLDRLVFKLKRIWKYTPALLKFVSSYSFALAALKEEEQACKDILITSNIRTVESDFYRCTVAEVAGGTKVNWQALAMSMKPSKQKITAYTEETAGYFRVDVRAKKTS